MAFTRKFLSSLGIDEDKVDTIMQAHVEVVDGLKDDIAKYKTDAEKLPEVQKQLDNATKDDGYKEKYSDLKKEYDDFKAEVSEKETIAKKTDAYKALLKDIGVADKRLGTVLKVDADIIKNIVIDEDGKVKDADDIKKTAKESWKDFIVTEETKGSDPAQPPTSTGGAMTKEDIYKKDDKGRYILSTAERQKAIAENHELFE